MVVAGPDDIWVGGEEVPGSPIYDTPSPLLAQWNGTSWTAASVPVSYGTVPSLTAAPDGQPAWAAVAPYGAVNALVQRATPS